MIEEILVKKTKTGLVDSGERKEFESGAKRDIRQGNGRFDLLPLTTILELYKNQNKFSIEENKSNRIDTYYDILSNIQNFMMTGESEFLLKALFNCQNFYEGDYYTLVTNIAKQMEKGCEKYNDIDEDGKINPNTMKGVPLNSYMDSAIRHLMKCIKGMEDEDHHIATAWNIMMAYWTKIHRPKLDNIKHETFLGDMTLISL